MARAHGARIGWRQLVEPFGLEQALEREPGGWWWMSSFGAGFSCHGALLRVE